METGTQGDGRGDLLMNVIGIEEAQRRRSWSRLCRFYRHPRCSGFRRPNHPHGPLLVCRCPCHGQEKASKSPSPSTYAIRKAIPYIAGGR